MASSNWIWSEPHQDYYYGTHDSNGQIEYHWAKEISQTTRHESTIQSGYPRYSGNQTYDIPDHYGDARGAGQASGYASPSNHRLQVLSSFSGSHDDPRTALKTRSYTSPDYMMQQTFPGTQGSYDRPISAPPRRSAAPQQSEKETYTRNVGISIDKGQSVIGTLEALIDTGARPRSWIKRTHVDDLGLQAYITRKDPRMYQTPNGQILSDESIQLYLRFEGGRNWYSGTFRILDNDSIRSAIILGQNFLNRYGIVSVNDHLFPIQETGPPTQEELDAIKAAEASQSQNAR
ncbi:hypothetical protein K491DRAFT_690368 [Lophiostoma macrostomum CBS 122681]|uniref:Uncharacterized protein n=1 Tax=Lophiostoma macrostomum CBS 122681 TaxID=1314788 RepID=A0A6A6THV3_9PLEO|nr:hypothetical protein K491DRAFT_690368 [Lophiostoma macrostomum CBS 122681]